MVFLIHGGIGNTSRHREKWRKKSRRISESRGEDVGGPKVTGNDVMENKGRVVWRRSKAMDGFQGQDSRGVYWMLEFTEPVGK